MKKPLFLLAAVCCSIMLLLSSCSKDDSKPKTVAEETIDNMDDYFLITPDGVELQILSGSILDPTGTSQINIEIKRIGSESDLPRPLPSGYTRIGNIIHCGPDNFAFVGHALLYMPAPGASSPDGLKVLWYNSKSNRWEVLMISDIDADGKRLGVSVLELGYFVVVQNDAVTKWIRPQGGFLINHGNPPSQPWGPSSGQYSYYLTVYNVDFKYEEDVYDYQYIFGYAGRTACATASCGWLNSRTTLSYLPLGKYTIILSRYKRGTSFDPIGGPFETYSIPYVADLQVYQLRHSWSDFDINSNSGWTMLGTPPSGGVWKVERPDTWAPPSLPPDDDNDNGSSCGNITFTYKGQQVTYGTVSRGGLCWMDRNLGASRVPTSSTDSQGYGDLFQWGRLDDGHQNRTSGTTHGPVNQDVPGHGNFITVSSSPWDWRLPQNNALWQGEDGINNPCPPGWRVPTEAELNAERQSWGSNNSAGAYASTLKWPVGGGRGPNGSLSNVGSDGSVWSSSVDGTTARLLAFYSGDAYMVGCGYRASGMSVRCVRD